VFAFFEFYKMGIGRCVFAFGLAMALASVAFVALASQHGWSGGPCEIAGGFCERPLLLLVPVLTTLAWGLMLALDD
jgi:hypothetical protein